jgi:LL-diaminopimelate aminotransferase
MAQINPHFLKLKDDYLFAEVKHRFQEAEKIHSSLEFLNLGIGDVTKPLPSSVVKAFCEAVTEMGDFQGQRGYSPACGYEFLRDLILKNDYQGINLSSDEIFIGCGTKNDISHFQELFSISSKVAIADPTYPVYLDSNVMAGRTKIEGEKFVDIEFLPCKEENDFFPPLPKKPCQIIYLCSPNNPTGVAFTKKELEKWVDYAKQEKAILFFDAAYEAYITSKEIPHSIFEIEGADSVAVEFRSFSKTAGFTGLRLSYIVLPKKVNAFFKKGPISLHSLWKRYLETKVGGVSYPTQKAGAAIYTPLGKQEVKHIIESYMQGAFLLKEGLTRLGFKVYGGVDAPYLFCKTPKKEKSWSFFEKLLSKGIISIPGSGFGPSGEGFIRFSTFSPINIIEKALKRIERIDHDLSFRE